MSDFKYPLFYMNVKSSGKRYGAFPTGMSKDLSMCGNYDDSCQCAFLESRDCVDLTDNLCITNNVYFLKSEE